MKFYSGGRVGGKVQTNLKTLADLDVEGFKKQLIENGANPKWVERALEDVILCAMHKTRAEMTALPPELRLESVEWLRAHGYSRYKDLPLPPPGELPC